MLHPDFPARRRLSRKDRAAFLSGHTALATVGAVLLTHYGGRVARTTSSRFAYALVAVGLSSGTGFLRAKSAKHWPTDAVAGGLLGVLVSVLALRVARQQVQGDGRSIEVVTY